jgi:hypothetical protein
MTEATHAPGIPITWKLREAGAGDRALLAEWILADPWHRESCTAEAWLAARRGVQNLLAEDAEGALMFLRCSNAMRIDMQFAPDGESARRRAARALITGVPYLANLARGQQFREMIFESQSEKLASFLQRMGFRASTHEHILSL